MELLIRPRLTMKFCIKVKVRAKLSLFPFTRSDVLGPSSRNCGVLTDVLCDLSALNPRHDFSSSFVAVALLLIES